MNLNLLKESKGLSCKGLIFRAEINRYFTETKDGRLVIHSGYRLRQLKKESCTGCENCYMFLDDIHEIQNKYGSGIIGLEDIEHGKKYRLVVTNISTDWESGIVDDWDLKVEEIKE